MAKVLDFPKPTKTAAESKVIQLESFIHNYVIDLTRIRADLIRMRTALEKEAARRRLTLIHEDHSGPKS